MWWLIGTLMAMPTKDLERTINRAVKRVQRRRLAGTVVLVSYKGEIVYQNASGWLNVQERTEMQLDSIFRMYSLSKPVTSAAVMTLVDAGTVDLHAPISDYVPELSDLKLYTITGDVPSQSPTVADCLRHTSGFTYGIFGVSPVDAQYNVDHPLLAQDSKAFVDRLSELPLVDEPQTIWRYSVSTDVLGVLVERVTGQSLENYMHQVLFEPLNMVDTSFTVDEGDIERFGPMYTRFRVPIETVEDSPFRNPHRFQSGGGGLVSTAEDYSHFAEMLMNKGVYNGVRILSEQSVSLMTTNQLPNGVLDIEGDGFGFGFQVQTESNRQSPVGEYTWDGIGSTHFWASPEDELYVIALAQYMPFVPVLKYSLRPRIYRALDIELDD